jgi:elongation factor 1 alpha-like protein
MLLQCLDPFAAYLLSACAEMSRRKQVVYDHEWDGDDYYEEEEEEEEEGAASQYMWRGGEERQCATTSDTQVADDAQAELLDALADEFRACLGDPRIPRDQIDAVLVATDYDAEAAIDLLREQLEEAAADSAPAASRLESSRPSAIACMLDDDDMGDIRSPLPAQTTPGDGNDDDGSSDASLAARFAFSFDEPSPDDIVNRKQSGGKARKTALVFPNPRSRARVVMDAGKSRVKADPSAVVAEPRPHSMQAAPIGRLEKNPKQAEKKPPAFPLSSCAAKPLVQVKQRSKKVRTRTPAALAAAAPSVSIVVAGHVDAGKSTLLGHLLRLVGAVSVDPGRMSRGKGESSSAGSRTALAWTTDEDQVEQERGVTVDIATRIFTGRKSKTTFSMIDAPGHRDYVPAMILGACQASAALLVVDASIGEFESGFSGEGQTREHAVLLRSLGVVSLIVVVNKMDMVNFSRDRFVEIKQALGLYLKSVGWKIAREVSYVPAAGLTGVNLAENPAKTHPLAKWHTGGTVLDALERLPPTSAAAIAAAMDRPTRLVVSDAFRSSSLGGVIAVSGRLVSGTIATRDQLQLCPSTEIASVKALEVGSNARRGDQGVAVAGADNLPVSLGLTDISDTLVISPGDVLCDPSAPVPVVSRFRAQILAFETAIPLVQGTQLELHLGGMCEAATLSKLIQLVVPTSRGSAGCSGGEESSRKKAPRPRRLTKGDSAIIEVTVARPICVERAVDVKFLGRFALRSQGRTVAAGLVQELLQPAKKKKNTSNVAS